MYKVTLFYKPEYGCKVEVIHCQTFDEADKLLYNHCCVLKDCYCKLSSIN